MFNHEETRKLISAYLDGEARHEERLDVEKHLSECAECKRYYLEVEKLRVVMHGYGEEELSLDSEQKIKNDFLGGKLKREAVMKKKILISAGSVALVMVLVFTFAMQTMVKRGVQGRMKESAEKIAGGAAYSAGGTNDSFNVYEGDARLTTVAQHGSSSVLKKGGAATNGFRWESKDGAYRHTDYAMAARRGARLEPLSDESFASRRPWAITAAKSITSQDALKFQALPQAYPEYSDVPVVIVEPYLPQSGNGEKVIYSAAAYIKVKDAQAAYDRAAQITRENKGFLGSTNFEQTSDGKAVAHMMLRVPREKFEAVLSSLRTLGDVKGINSSNVDISQQYQELTQQLDNAKVVYDKMVAAFKDKKTDIEKAQRMENTLTPYLIRIEALRNQLAVYDNQVAMSTITVTFEESSLRTFLKHDFEDIHAQMAQKAATALKSLALMVPAFIAFVVALLCALAAWNVLRNNFLKK